METYYDCYRLVYLITLYPPVHPPLQVLATIGASALKEFQIGDTLYLAVASFTDTRYVYIVSPR